jgi:hypothetical protein
MSDDNYYSDWFREWWDTKEPFGYDNPDIREPISNMFRFADNGTRDRDLILKKLKEENKKFRERVRLELKYILVQQELTYGMNKQEACSFRERKILSLISELVMECEDE